MSSEQSSKTTTGWRSSLLAHLWRRGPVLGTLIAGFVFYLYGSGSPFRANQMTLWVIFGLLALSLTFIWGKAGIFSFGQGALFGVGGYAYGIAAINLSPSTNETLTSVLIAVVVAAGFAAALGYFMFYGNLSGVYVAIVTLATSLVLLTFMGSTAGPQWRIGEAQLGGYNGMVGVPPITLGLPGGSANVLNNEQLLAGVIIVAIGVTLGVWSLLRRPFGRSIVAIRDNEERARLLGYDTRATKLIVFAIGGAIAGLAGAGYAAWGVFINPAVFGLQQAAMVVIWVLVGGRRSLPGAFIGVALLQWMASQLGAGAGSWTPIVLGGALIFIVLVIPRGLVPTLISSLQRAVPPLVPPPPVLPPPAEDATPVGRRQQGTADTALSTEGLSKSFGGLVAVKNVTVDFPTQRIHALIGPNGAGKSTVFNLLVGRLRPSEGTVRLGQRDITRLLPHKRARLGVGIKLQIPSIFRELTVAENLWLAAYRSERHVRQTDARVADLLEWLNLRDVAWTPAGTLAHGQQQRLEIGLVLATAPSVVLLDEPTAGMTRDETSDIANLVRELSQYATVVVVEHDMEFVRQLDCPATMLHQGSILVSGSLDELRADERVLDIYLGRETHA